MSASITVNRVQLTPELLRTAFRDSLAREMLNGARVARFRQDSSLRSYDARGYERISVDLGMRILGRERLAFRRESATRVRWEAGKGALVVVEGARAVVPIVENAEVQAEVSRETADESGGDAAAIPYFPGKETLWIGSDLVSNDVNENALVHPLVEGAEAYYRYATGDSIMYRLPDGRQISIIELRITPRQPRWNLVVGSFWFDRSSYQPVRAAYRLAVPIDIWEVAVADGEGDELPRWVVGMLSPMKAELSAVTIEYGLFETRYWLPVVQTATGRGQFSAFRVPVQFERKFEYSSVNVAVDVPDIPVTAEIAYRDTLRRLDSLSRGGDSTARETATAMRERRREEQQAITDTVRSLKRAIAAGDSALLPRLREIQMANGLDQCEYSDTRTTTVSRFNNALYVRVEVPCNDSLLANSPRLPPSIFTPSDSLLGASEREALASLLSMGLQADFHPQAIHVLYGPGGGLMRYNRIEGLSPAIQFSQTLGEGLSWVGLVRAGTADGEVNGELALSRGNGRNTWTLGGYRRLAVANDWGNPLSLGASFQALLFGRDEGFYYRSTGVELMLSGSEMPLMEWRAFAERHRHAEVEAEFSLANSLNDVVFADNIVADEGDVYGLAGRMNFSLGKNPMGFRVLGDLRAERGTGDFDYGRGLFDLTLSEGVGDFASVALTLSAGSSTGTLPVQRLFQLGGTQSIRGQRAGAMSGDAFWMGRFEVGTGAIAAKPVVFADIGWAGARGEFDKPGVPLSGAGVGVSLVDGLIRMDLARGVNPSRRWTFAMYLEARF